MKKVYLAAGLMTIAAIAFLLVGAGDVTTYSTFDEARSTTKKVKIAAKLLKDKPIQYDPEADANSFSFFVEDAQGEQMPVRLLMAKPQDFELSEQVVLTGKIQDNTFIATDVLLKCPSKYKEEELYLRDQ